MNSLLVAAITLQADFVAFTHSPLAAAVADFKFVHKVAGMKEPCFGQRRGKWLQWHLSVSLNAGLEKQESPVTKIHPHISPCHSNIEDHTRFLLRRTSAAQTYLPPAPRSSQEVANPGE